MKQTFITKMTKNIRIRVLTSLQFLQSEIHTERVQLQEEDSEEVLVKHDEVAGDQLWVSVAITSYLTLAAPPALEKVKTDRIL